MNHATRLALGTSLCLFSACGGAEFGGNSSSSRQQAATRTPVSTGQPGETPNTPSGVSGDSLPVDVHLEDGGEAEGLALAAGNALIAYKADLVGGAGCWGAQPTPFASPSAGALVVLKDATGCAMKFTELTIKKAGADLALTNATGLLTTAAADARVEFENNANAAAPIIMSVNVASGLSTANGTVRLFGRQSEVQGTPVPVDNQDVLVSAGGDVLPAPHVMIDGTVARFNGNLTFKIKCASNGPANTGACIPSVAAGANGTLTNQELVDMRIVTMKIPKAGFPGNVTAALLDSLFVAADARTPVVPSGAFVGSLTGVKLPTSVAATEQAVIVIRYIEGTNHSYRVIPATL